MKIQEFQHLLEMLRIDCNLMCDIIEVVQVSDKEDHISGGKRNPSDYQDIDDAEEPERIDNEYYEVYVKIEDKAIKVEDSNQSSK